MIPSIRNLTSPQRTPQANLRLGAALAFVAGAANAGGYLAVGQYTSHMTGIISLMAWGLGYMGQPHILARFMAISSVDAMPNARRIGMTWMILCLGGAVAVGTSVSPILPQIRPKAGLYRQTTKPSLLRCRNCCLIHGLPVCCCRLF